jgi:hypothetical protein
MHSSQMPNPATLAASCLPSSWRWSGVSRSHIAVPYSVLRCSGRKSLPSCGGADQSMSSSGS